MSVMAEFDQTISDIAEVIVKHIPDNPKIMSLDSPWGLLSIPGVQQEIDALEPTLGQVTAALERAQATCRVNYQR